ATDFYRTLVLDRATLGDSLRLAKRGAHARLPEIDPSNVDTVAPTAPQERLSWASLVLYGDATATLMQRLGSILESSGPSVDAAGGGEADTAGTFARSANGGSGSSGGSSAGLSGGAGGGASSGWSSSAGSGANVSVRRGETVLPSALPAD